MTELEKHQLKEYKKYLRLSSERDLYTIPQAAFRLGIGRNEFESSYVRTGKIMLRIRDGKKLVAKSEIEKAIDEMQRVVHITPKYFKSNIKVSSEYSEAWR